MDRGFVFMLNKIDPELLPSKQREDSYRTWDALIPRPQAGGRRLHREEECDARFVRDLRRSYNNGERQEMEDWFQNFGISPEELAEALARPGKKVGKVLQKIG